MLVHLVTMQFPSFNSVLCVAEDEAVARQAIENDTDLRKVNGEATPSYTISVSHMLTAFDVEEFKDYVKFVAYRKKHGI